MPLYIYHPPISIQKETRHSISPSSSITQDPAQETVLAQDRESKEEVGDRCSHTARLLGYRYKIPPKVCAKEKAKKKTWIQWSSEDIIIALAG
jgi:hypothetical protein